MFSSFLNVGMSKIKTLGQMQQTRASLLLIGPLKSVINWGCAVRFFLPAKGLLSHRLMGWWWVTLSRLSINSQFPRNVSLFLALSILLYFQLFSNLNKSSTRQSSYNNHLRMYIHLTIYFYITFLHKSSPFFSFMS